MNRRKVTKAAIELKKRIQEKYVSIRRFARLIDVDPVFLTEQLRGGRLLTNTQAVLYGQLIDRVKDTPIEGIDMTLELRQKIRDAILAHPGSLHVAPDLPWLEGKRTIAKFCRTNDYDPSWMAKVLNESKYQTNTITPKIKELIKILELDGKD